MISAFGHVVEKSAEDVLVYFWAAHLLLFGIGNQCKGNIHNLQTLILSVRSGEYESLQNRLRDETGN